MIVRDEVMYARSYNVIYGLSESDSNAGLIVGGEHPGFGKLSRKPGDHVGLEKERLAPGPTTSLVWRNIPAGRLDCPDSWPTWW